MEHFLSIWRLICEIRYRKKCVSYIDQNIGLSHLTIKEANMFRKSSFIPLMLISFILLVSCNSKQTPTAEANMPNPASVYCEEQGNKLEIITAEDGSQSSVCIFPDGSKCDEWAYFRGECKPGDSQNTPAPESTSEANMPNPASVYCEQQGNKLEIVTASDGSQSGVCIFPDGSSCDEWAYFRGECGPADQTALPSAPTEIPTALPIDPADYQGWWTYTHPVYGFSIMLPEDWVVEDVTTSDPLMNGHILSLHPKYDVEKENIRMTFRPVGEEIPLWPTGVGQGEFIPHGTLDVAGQPAQRVLLVCPTGEIAEIWYHQSEGVPSIIRDDLEFGFIFNASSSHCEAGYTLTGKIQYVGEMIIASLTVP
jgi:putative hemolysin